MPKQLIKQNISYSDYFNVTSGFTWNSRATGGPVTHKSVAVTYMLEYANDEIEMMANAQN